MASGVAALIRAKYPVVYEEYARVYDTQGGLRLGQTIWVETPDFTVINGITQQNYGRDPNTIYADYDAIAEVIRDIDRQSSTRGVDAVAMPLIGAGLANGKWSVISKIIEEEATAFQPVVYLLDGKIPQ